MPAQFQTAPAVPALCVRFPHVPITQVAERQGSGKLTLSKSGASGTRVWQCPWFFYPAFCDFLLGRTAVNPNGRPQLYRPDVFSPCYPWLYCQEASVEGEDLLGVDASLRAFYRRAIVTAKYAPLELNNSIHINSQMLTIPNSQFIFIGQNPNNLAGFQQIFGVEMTGKAIGGTFVLVFTASGAATFLPPAAGGGGTGPGAAIDPKATSVRTPPIPYNASPAQVVQAVRAALGLTTPKNRPGAVTVSGPEPKSGASGPWVVTLNVPEVYNLSADATNLVAPKNGLVKTASGVGEPAPAYKDRNFYFADNSGTETTPIAPNTWWVQQTEALKFVPGTRDEVPGQDGAAHPALFRLEWTGKLVGGSFRFKIKGFSTRFVAGSGPNNQQTNYSREVQVTTCKPHDILAAMLSALETATPPPQGAKKNTVMRAFPTGGTGDFGAVYETSPAYLSYPYQNGRDILPDNPGGPVQTQYSNTLSEIAAREPEHPMVLYFGWHSLTYTITECAVVWSGSGADGAAQSEKPALKLIKYDPYLANRLDQNVGKVVPMGEITFQRHQVVATDLVYLLAVIGSVNMFTFQGFPPWTLLLSGIEAKQTRLPNGTPCFDMTFKFAFNPYTHQAIFRPLNMRWEFVRGVLVARIPSSVAVPKNPLNSINGRATVNPKAAASAWADPKPPRVIPLVIDPRSGVGPVRGGPGGVTGAAPPAGGGGPPMAYSGGGDFGGGGDYSGGGDFGPSSGRLGAGYSGGGDFGNVNPNPTPNASTGQTQVGQIDSPFGTVPASANEGNLLNLIAGLMQLSQDPNSPTHDPTANWEGQANILGDAIARSVGAAENNSVANADQAAAASGIAADIEQGRIDGADWITTYDTGVTISPTAGATGNPEYDLALARAAHACGAKLAPCTRELLGLPAEPAGAAPGGGALGAGPGSIIIGAAGAVATDVQKAANVGASNSPQQMSTRVFDLGLIYPICDFTPILWMQ